MLPQPEMPASWIVLGALALLALSPSANAVTIQPVYLDSPTTGFNDAAQGPARRAAFEYALAIWGGALAGSVPIKVEARFTPLSGAFASALPGSFHHQDLNFPEAPLPNTDYPSALANQLAQRDLNGDAAELSIDFDGDGSTTWCYETDFYDGSGPSPLCPNVNFVKIALHEIAHGLGFFTRVRFDGNLSSPPYDRPSAYDLNLLFGGVPFAQSDPITRGSAIAANNVFLAGPHVVALHGAPAKLFTSPADKPNSLSHLDLSLTAELMRYSGSQWPTHKLGLTLPALQDMGWTPACPPGSGSFDPACGLGQDHVRCDKAHTTSNTPRFARQYVTLADSLGTKTATVVKPARFCSPIDVDASGIMNAEARLECYKIKDGRPRTSGELVVQSRFGRELVRILKGESLCVITQVGPGELPGGLDHFKCYKARSERRAEAFCAAVGIDGSTVSDPAARLGLICYDSQDFGLADVQSDVEVNNRFGGESLSVTRADRVCVPAVEVGPGTP